MPQPHMHILRTGVGIRLAVSMQPPADNLSMLAYRKQPRIETPVPILKPHPPIGIADLERQLAARGANDSACRNKGARVDLFNPPRISRETMASLASTARECTQMTLAPFSPVLRVAETTGRSLGTADFVADLERRLGRSIARRAPGRKPASKGADQGVLL